MTNLSDFSKKQYNNIMEHIENARIKALENAINANKILIDKDVAMVNGIYVPIDEYRIEKTRPMILGMQVEYEEKLNEFFGVNFFLYEKKEEPINQEKRLEDYTNEELMEELGRRMKNV